MGAGTRENINVEKTLGEQLLENLKDLKEQSFNDIKEETLRERRETNVYKLLIKAGIDKFLGIEKKEDLLKAYEDMLKISLRGFYIN